MFYAETTAAGGEPFASDGTQAGTTLLRDLWPGAGGSYPYEFRASGSRLAWFVAETPNEGGELWVTDGTAAGTKLVADLFPGSDGSYPEYRALSRGRLYVAADDGIAGTEIWVMDPGASTKEFGVPYADATRAPRLTTTDPEIGQSMRFDASGLASTTALVLLVSAPGQPIHAGGGAFLNIDPATYATFVVAASDAQGRWTLALPLPPIFSILKGVTVASQVIAGPTATPLGADATNGVHWTFGN